MNPHRILIVEDEAIVAMDIESRLAALGYGFAGRGASGAQALALAEAARPDLVLMDVRLQGEMDGIDAAREIYQRFQIPVIFLTAYSEEATLERVKLAEPFGCILKPFDDRELKSAIEIALAKHRTEQELHRSNRLYAVLSHVNEAIIHITAQEELFQSVCRVVVGYGELDLAWVGWLDRESGRLKPVAWFGKEEGPDLRAAFPAADQPGAQGHPDRAILREGRPFVCNGCGAGECLYPEEGEPPPSGARSCAAFPLWFQNEVRGVLNFRVSAPSFFKTPEVELLGEVAADVSFALDKMEGDRQRRQAAKEKELTAEVLGLINSAADTRTLLKAVLACLKRGTGCEAVGIRLQEREDFPYFETSGFPESFVRLESSLCTRDAQGEIVRDPEGNPLLECMCGNILRERVDPGKSFFTDGGSFWSNCTTELLATTTEADRQTRTRNRCNGAGYESVALIPLRSGGQTFGLIQLNDKRPGRFSAESIVLFERLGKNIANFLDKIRLEERLRESEAKLRALGDNLPDGYVYQYTHDRDGSPRFLYVSAGVQQIHGVSPEETVRDAGALLGQLDPLQAETYVEKKRESAAEMADFAMDLHTRSPEDGRWRWLHASARPHQRADGQVIWDGVVIDITARREAEAQLHKLSAVVEQTPAVVVITDPLARIEYVNPAFTRITGYTFAEARGKNPGFLKSGETPAEVYRDLWQTISAGREWRGILHNRRKDGTLFWERVVIFAIRDAAGKTTSLVAVKEDITEQKGLEDQLHQAQKMESVGRLAGGVAHDFNNMLMVISGYADLTLMQTAGDDPRYPGLQEIRDAARRSANLTRQLLAFARKQTVAPVVLDMNDTIAGMLKMLRRLIGEDIELAWLPGPELWKVRIDPSQIDQLLANLAVNARDAIAGVGTVAIKTDNRVLDAAYCVRHQGCTPGEHVVLTVSDTGIGMSREVVEHIFEPFFTTKEEGKGTGLGLATVYGIVKQNLGFISVESEPGRGTTFLIHLPRFVEEARADLAAQEREEALPRGTETVLLVEDEEALLALGRRFIERLGYTVLTAGSPDEAMRQAEEYKGAIDLLVTDIVMPGMNGKELAERLRQRFPGLKCLFMSGYSADIIAKQGVLEEGIHFLPKPFSLREIAFKARQALAESR